MEEEGMEEATGAESRNHSCSDPQAEAISRDTLPTDEGSSGGSNTDERATDGLPTSIDQSNLSNPGLLSDGTAPISDYPIEGDLLWVCSW